MQQEIHKKIYGINVELDDSKLYPLNLVQSYSYHAKQEVLAANKNSTEPQPCDVVYNLWIYRWLQEK
jgi:hypothetical protein